MHKKTWNELQQKLKNLEAQDTTRTQKVIGTAELMRQGFFRELADMDTTGWDVFSLTIRSLLMAQNQYPTASEETKNAVQSMALQAAALFGGVPGQELPQPAFEVIGKLASLLDAQNRMAITEGVMSASSAQASKGFFFVALGAVLAHPDTRDLFTPTTPTALVTNPELEKLFAPVITPEPVVPTPTQPANETIN